jgi:hypothetical protein
MNGSLVKATIRETSQNFGIIFTPEEVREALVIRNEFFLFHIITTVHRSFS